MDMVDTHPHVVSPESERDKYPLAPIGGIEPWNGVQQHPRVLRRRRLHNADKNAVADIVALCIRQQQCTAEQSVAILLHVRVLLGRA